jgi:large subunit ribosomal protein L30
MNDRKLEIKLTRSYIGKSRRHKDIVAGLGLKKMNQTVVRPDSPEIRGMIRKISYLLEVTEK